MASFDEIAAVGVPILIVAVIIGFIVIKWVMPNRNKFEAAWEWIKGKSAKAKTKKVIEFGDDW